MSANDLPHGLWQTTMLTKFHSAAPRSNESNSRTTRPLCTLPMLPTDSWLPSKMELLSQNRIQRPRCLTSNWPVPQDNGLRRKRRLSDRRSLCRHQRFLNRQLSDSPMPSIHSTAITTRHKGFRHPHSVLTTHGVHTSRNSRNRSNRNCVKRDRAKHWWPQRLSMLPG